MSDTYRQQTSEPVSLLPKTLRTIKQALYERGRYDEQNRGFGELPVLIMTREFTKDEQACYISGLTDEACEHPERFLR